MGDRIAQKATSSQRRPAPKPNATMGKRKIRSKRSVTRTPKGVPHKDAAASANSSNPFESNSHRSAKRPKFQVHNRHTGAPPGGSTTTTQNRTSFNKNAHSSSFQQQHQKQSALASAIQQRRDMIRAEQKVNVFRDQRLLDQHRHNDGPNNNDVNDLQLARLVKERSNQSKRSRKYQLDDEVVLTHRGRALGNPAQVGQPHPDNDPDDIFLTEQEENVAVGELDEADTSLHFGGHADDANNTLSYGRTDMASQYLSRKTELDDLIARRKRMKAEKQKVKGTQEDVFTELDDQFKELSQLLDYRDKEKYEKERFLAKRRGTQDETDAAMDEWDAEMKQYMTTSSEKVKATDRTKTGEEIAQDEADRLHALETRRLARMQGDFDNDDLSDVHVDVDVSLLPPETIVDGDGGEDHQQQKKGPSVRFTADGLVNVDEEGNITGKFGEEEEPNEDSFDEDGEASDDDDDEEEEQEPEEVRRPPKSLHKVGAKVMASYRASEQYDGGESWFSGTIVKVYEQLFAYDIEYDDGDFEEKVTHVNIQHMERDSTAADKPDPKEPVVDEALLRKKRAIAKEKARYETHPIYLVCRVFGDCCVSCSWLAHHRVGVSFTGVLLDERFVSSAPPIEMKRP
jgi:nucleolar protein 14